MIKKSLLFIGVGFMLLLSGCASTHVTTSNTYQEIGKEGGRILAVASQNWTDSTYGFVHTQKNVNARFLLQSDAIKTLANGAEYFRIIMPFDSSAEMITTPEELSKRCFDNGVESVFIGSKRCYYRQNRAYVNKIIMYDERPKKVLTINAQGLLDYYKEKDWYIEEDEIEYFTTSHLTPTLKEDKKYLH